jgi:Domain of unknown function (DUF4166)
MAQASRVSKLSPPPPTHDRLLDDHRFRTLLSDEDWGRLPLAIWRRFSTRFAEGATVVYVGKVDQAEFSRLGWWLAQCARLIGGPLPTSAETGCPAIVSVTEDAALGGQIWTRIYARRNRFPQVIHSAKRFCGPTGLEEYVGFGLAMALQVSVADQALQFTSAGYFVELGPLRLTLPPWLTPGELTVTHADLGGGAFRFTLDIIHPRYGRLVRQSAVFKEAAR